MELLYAGRKKQKRKKMKRKLKVPQIKNNNQPTKSNDLLPYVREND